MSAFELSKWYADCISENGDAAILYRATLRIGGIPIHYESLLTKPQDSPPHVRYSIRPRGGLSIGNNQLNWTANAWKASGSWTNHGHGHCETLYSQGDDDLVWNCFAPRASASLKVGDEFISGWGYAEQIRLTIPPWRLPIKTLRWGRFVNENDTLTWIDWTGPTSKQVVLFNGKAVESESISDDRISFHHGEGLLELGSKQVIREGQLGSTALAVIPKLTSLFPDSVLNMYERKWLSRAVLHRKGHADSVGMAIHEVVEWP